MNAVVSFANVKRVLVFGAHGDDEIIGPGATIYRLAQLGAKVTVATFTYRETASQGDVTEEAAKQAAIQEMEAADHILGIRNRVGFGYKNREVRHDGESIVRCAKLIREVKPDLIFVHASDDQHTDHRAVASVVKEAVWKAWENIQAHAWGPPHSAPLLLEYEIMFRRLSDPTFFVTFGKEALEKKLEAMRSQFSQLENLRDILGYMEHTARGLGGLVNAYAAEPFRVVNAHPVEIAL